LLSALDAAQFLGVHERTVRRAIARGALPATKRSGIWRIDPDDLDRLRQSAARNARVPRPATAPSLVLLPQAPARPPFMVHQPRTPLIGREREIDSVCVLVLDERAPLVTLTGTGGSGKTRLALAIAASLRDRFADGIWFVDLSVLRDADLVPGAIVQALQIQEVAGEAQLDRLQGYLQSRTTLLVLDNVEQVVAAAPAIGQLLTACPGLQVLATSRIPLHVSMEHQVRVAPLDLPRSDLQPDRDEVEAASATRLFRQMAQRVRSDFQVTDANAPAVAALCARLDGLPLAIELAAAQSAVYTPQSLLERLDNRLGVLDHGPHDAPPRLRSMRDAIGWSYDLLDERLQQRFRRLSVFDGGFTADTAAVVTSHPPLDPASCDVQVRALVDASLVIASPETSRFTMLETIRAFGQEQLESQDEAVLLREAHAGWCHDLLTRAHLHWFTPTQTVWGDRIEQEHANLRAALSWLDAGTHQADVISLAGLMWPFWFVRNHWQEGMAWLERALDASAGQHTLARIRVLVGAGCLWIMHGDEPAARAFNEEALALCHELGDAGPPDNPLNGLAICANMRGDFEEGRRLNLEALAELRAHAETDPSALPLVSVILQNMASNAFHQGNIDEAERLATEALGMQRASGFDWAAADSVCILAEIALHRHRPKLATTLFHQGLQLGLSGGDRLAIARELIRFAGFAGTSGAIEQALTLFGASEHLLEVLGAQLSMGQRETMTRIEMHGHERLGADTARLYRRAGQGLSIEDAVALTLQVPVPPTVSPILANYGITRREFDVLGLVAKGLTDQEIADALFIGHRTVHTHVSRLLDKLGAANRREAVARARAEHLLDDPSLHAALS
jgi:non-specific serine/threonine protein kinase